MSPQRFPFFYGWLLIPVGVLGLAATMPGQTVGVSAFTNDLIDTLGISRVQLTTAYMVGTLISALFLTKGGQLLDRYGVRMTMVAVCLFFSLSLVLLSGSGWLASSLGAVLNEPHRRWGITAVISVCFLFLRFGAHLMAMIPRVMLGRWFRYRLGMAMGIFGPFVSLAFGMSPLAYNHLVEKVGWQQAYLLLAAAVGLGMSSVAWIFYRERPEDFGLVKDGTTKVPSRAANREVRDFTLTEARQTLAFWVYSLAIASHALIVTGITFHMASLVTEVGLTKSQGFQLFIPISIVSILVNFTSSWLSGRVRLKLLLVAMLIAQFGAVGGMLVIGEVWGRVLYVTMAGAANGLWETLVGVTWPRYFGSKHLGAISGLQMTIMVIASSLGPFILGMTFESTGSYAAGLLVCGGAPLVLLMLSGKVKNPQNRYRGSNK